MASETDSITVPAPYVNEPRVEKDANGVWHVRGYAEARELLREELIQDGFKAEDVRRAGFEGVLFIDGELHRQHRAAIAKFFSPTTVQQSHMPLIEKTADELIVTLKKNKRMDLKVLSRHLATIITSVVVGLTPSKGMVHRLDDMLYYSPVLSDNLFLRVMHIMQGHYRRLAFLLADVIPEMSRRRKVPQNDVISDMVAKGKGAPDIMVECIIYGAAGIVTTQEFMCIVLLQCMRDEKLRMIMISDDVTARHEALNEILRLEPVIANIYRKAPEPVTVKSEDKVMTIPAHERIAFHVYDINVDSKATGEAPMRLNPHRELEKGVYRSLLGFGAGPHRCAGEHLAIAETDIFINKLLKIPGLRIESGPNIRRNDTVEGYEVNDLILAVN